MTPLSLQAAQDSGVFVLEDDAPEEAWERSGELARIAASTRTDTRTHTHTLTTDTRGATHACTPTTRLTNDAHLCATYTR
jgi:hypothetical protein